jgi:hypothetical protein
VKEIGLACHRDRLGTAVDIEFHQDVANVCPDCVWGDLKRLSDRFVAKALAKEGENALFTIGQLGNRGPPVARPYRLREYSAPGVATRMERSDRADQDIWFGVTGQPGGGTRDFE